MPRQIDRLDIMYDLWLLLYISTVIIMKMSSAIISTNSCVTMRDLYVYNYLYKYNTVEGLL